MTVVIGQHEWEITLNGEPVEYLFDRNGSETFDATRAVEVQTHSGFVELEPGDTLKFERIQ
jgi:hypothetical protein